jgi:hypothetical protein
LTRGEIESICQHEFEAEEKRLEVKREKEIKQLIIAQIQQANGS